MTLTYKTLLYGSALAASPTGCAEKDIVSGQMDVPWNDSPSIDVIAYVLKEDGND
jgi:hypothetical protein